MTYEEWLCENRKPRSASVGESVTKKRFKRQQPQLSVEEKRVLSESKRQKREVERQERLKEHEMRRKVRADARALKHEVIMSPTRLGAHLRRKHKRRVEAEHARAQASFERELKKQRHVRRRSPEYYATWTERLMRYVHRRLRRGKRVSKEALAAMIRVNGNIVA